MEIEFIKNDNFLDVKEFIIRKIKRYCDECEKEYSSDHFQALVTDRRKKKDATLSCRIRYENKNGEFVGVDEDTIYGVGNTTEIVVSMPVTVPETAVKAKVDIEERSYPGYSEYSDYILGAGIIALLVALIGFAAKGIFNW